MGWGLLIFYVTNVTNETNVIQVHFVGFSNRLSPAKAVPLHRISKRAETANRRPSAANHPLTVRTLPAPPLKGGNFSPL